LRNAYTRDRRAASRRAPSSRARSSPRSACPRARGFPSRSSPQLLCLRHPLELTPMLVLQGHLPGRLFAHSVYFLALAWVSAKYLAYSSPTMILMARPWFSSLLTCSGSSIAFLSMSRSLLTIGSGMPLGPRIPRVEFEMTVG